MNPTEWRLWRASSQRLNGSCSSLRRAYRLHRAFYFFAVLLIVGGFGRGRFHCEWPYLEWLLIPAIGSCTYYKEKYEISQYVSKLRMRVHDVYGNEKSETHFRLLRRRFVHRR